MGSQGLYGGFTCSITSSRCNSLPNRRYDVFLSYTGSDSKNFRGHLINNLSQKGLSIFKDNEIGRGRSLSPALNSAIECSRASIIVFSEKYAESTWCLDELLKILECKELNGQSVRTIFYKVDPSTVRNQTGRYGQAMAAHENRFVNDLKKVDNWRRALKKAADLTGWTFTDDCDEPNFMQKVVEEVSRELAHRECMYVTEYPVGLKSRVSELNSILDVGKDRSDVKLVVVYGPQGIGKTTIAKAVYNSNVLLFEGSSFLVDVSETLKKPLGLAELQTSLLSEILRVSNMNVGHVDKGLVLIKKRLQNKRVLLVLDGVNSLYEVQSLAKRANWFGKGSRIIVTTRDVNMIKLPGFPLVYNYEVKRLDNYDALKLFLWKAFADETISDDFKQLVKLAMQYAQGYPSRLVQMGTSLCGKSKDEWIIELKRFKRNYRQGNGITTIFQTISQNVGDIFNSNSQNVGDIFNSNSPPDSRFLEVVKPNRDYSINIMGKILKEKLYRGIYYTIYLVFKFEGPISPFKEGDIKLTVNPGGSEVGKEHAVFLNPSKDAHELYEKREDGCMGIKMANFINIMNEPREELMKISKGEIFINNDDDVDDDEEISSDGMDLAISVNKIGIIVEGIEFRIKWSDSYPISRGLKSANLIRSILLDNEGKLRFMLDAKNLPIPFIKNEYWNGPDYDGEKCSLEATNFSGIETVFQNCMEPSRNYLRSTFNIEGSIESNLFSSETTYLIYFVFKFEGSASKFTGWPVKFTINYERTVGKIVHYAFLGHLEKAQQLVCKSEYECCYRENGWIEIKMGELFVYGEENCDISFSICILDDNLSILSAGLDVIGVDFRPK